ncbi:MAG: DinB family protein [Telluria sp.]
MHRIKPGDKSCVLAYDEIVKGLEGNIYSLVNVAPDLQQLYIDLTVNTLKRRNPHTGRTYAQEPALAFIEFRNEDDIFWPSTQNAVEKCPTYKKRFNEYFSDWLQKKYGTQEKLVAAWGPRALNAYPEYQKDESLAARNIYPIAHFWWYTPEGLKNQEENKGTRRRLLDTARFLYEFQNDFYTRFARAIRATGYKGPLVGSCWQAGEGVPNWYNLHSDYLAGVIDRHNYFGGQTESWFLKPQTKIDNRSMLSQPGSGLLSTGMQMVKDRPFALSEWIHVTPSEWNAEGPALIAAYGMGLQGWDASYHFAINVPRFANTINEPRLWNVDTPTQIGLYPAVARMVHRSDVREGAFVSTRKVHIPGLAEGRLGFEERVTQTGDVKSFGGDVPVEALAAGKVAVEFTAKAEPTLPVDLKRYTRSKVITSSTGELQWNYAEAGKGFCTINTPGTKAVVGFAPGRNFMLGEVSMRVDNSFAVVFVTSLERNRAIAGDGCGARPQHGHEMERRPHPSGRSRAGADSDGAGARRHHAAAPRHQRRQYTRPRRSPHRADFACSQWPHRNRRRARQNAVLRNRASLNASPKGKLVSSKPAAQRLCDELNLIRRELSEEVRRLQPEHLDWSPQPGMKSYRALLAEIAVVESGCRAWAVSESDESDWDEQIKSAPDAESLLQVLKQIRAQTLSYLQTCSEEELQATVTVPEHSRQYVGGPTHAREEIFRWIARHEYYHLGQIITYHWLRGDNPYQRG